MIFSNNIILKTSLTKDNINLKLGSVIHDFDYVIGNKMFKGQFIDNKFYLTPLFKIFTRRGFDILIIGEVCNGTDFRELHLKFRLTKIISNTFKFVFILNLIILLLLVSTALIFPDAIDIPDFNLIGIIIFYFFGILGTFLVFLLGFNRKVVKSVSLLIRAIQS